MHAVRVEREREVDSIVDDEAHAECFRRCAQHRTEREEIAARPKRISKLYGEPVAKMRR